jgi:ABC-type Fe3+ transport system permease subunit
MVQFATLIAVLSFLAVIYSVFAMNQAETHTVLYLGILIMVIPAFLLSVGIIMMQKFNKKDF